jgi:hypothetical protein
MFNIAYKNKTIKRLLFCEEKKKQFVNFSQNYHQQTKTKQCTCKSFAASVYNVSTTAIEIPLGESCSSLIK